MKVLWRWKDILAERAVVFAWKWRSRVKLLLFTTSCTDAKWRGSRKLSKSKQSKRRHKMQAPEKVRLKMSVKKKKTFTFPKWWFYSLSASRPSLKAEPPPLYSTITPDCENHYPHVWRVYLFSKEYSHKILLRVKHAEAYLIIVSHVSHSVSVKILKWGEFFHIERERALV